MGAKTGGELTELLHRMVALLLTHLFWLAQRKPKHFDTPGRLQISWRHQFRLHKDQLWDCGKFPGFEVFAITSQVHHWPKSLKTQKVQ